MQSKSTPRPISKQQLTGNNYQGNRGLYHNPHRSFQQGNNYGQFRGRSHGHSRGNYCGRGHGRSNDQGNVI